MRILGMEASIRQFVRFRNPTDILNDIARAQPILVNMRRVAYQTENRFRCALAVMDIDALIPNLLHQRFNARLLCARLQNHNHGFLLLFRPLCI